jgi:hypothetical protein
MKYITNLFNIYKINLLDDLNVFLIQLRIIKIQIIMKSKQVVQN